MRPRVDVIVAAAAAGAAAVLAASQPPTIIGALLGVPLMLIAPGYALSRALLPGRFAGPAERATAALGLSLAFLVLAAVTMHAAGVPLSRRSWAAVVGAATVVATAVAAWRAPAPAVAGRLPRVRGARLLLTLVALVLLADAVVIARRPLAPPRGVPGYTQLWLIRTGRQAELGVHSYELAPAGYRLDLIVNGRVARRWPDIMLATGEGWSTAVRLAGSRIEARLYRADRPQQMYRHVRMAVPRSAPARS